jgi:hypothetical protein
VSKIRDNRTVAQLLVPTKLGRPSVPKKRFHPVETRSFLGNARTTECFFGRSTAARTSLRIIRGPATRMQIRGNGKQAHENVGSHWAEGTRCKALNGWRQTFRPSPWSCLGKLRKRRRIWAASRGRGVCHAFAGRHATAAGRLEMGRSRDLEHWTAYRKNQEPVGCITRGLTKSSLPCPGPPRILKGDFGDTLGSQRWMRKTGLFQVCNRSGNRQDSF